MFLKPFIYPSSSVCVRRIVRLWVGNDEEKRKRGLGRARRRAEGEKSLPFPVMVPTIPQFLHNLLGMRRTLSVRQAFLKVGRFAVWLVQLGGLEDAPALQALDVGSGIVLGD